MFAVLAEVDGTGVPLAYLFAKPKTDVLNHLSNTSAPLMELLHQFLGHISNRGFDPVIFGCDKDFAEIAAISNVFGTAKIQLCYWHVLRAIKSKLKSYAVTSGRVYAPQQAKDIVHNLEVCWGSRIEKRLMGHRPSDVCGCPSKGSHYDTPDRLEPRTVSDRDAVISLVHRHFNYHASFPLQSGVRRSAFEIHQTCACEMYNYCRQRDWWRTWAYFWTEWYAPEKWKLWPRSAHHLLPVLKTTMVLESHWRVLKQDFLHQYNRPRMDLVVHCIISELMPVMDRKLFALLSENQRVYKADWRRDFKKTWLAERNKPISGKTQHTTDVDNWVCSCTKFVLSRFLMCKHLVQKKELTGQVNGEFFRRIRRIRKSPFWVLPGHSEYPVYELDLLANDALEDHSSDDEPMNQIEGFDNEPLNQNVVLDNESENDVEMTPAEQYQDFLSTSREFLDLYPKRAGI